MSLYSHLGKITKYETSNDNDSTNLIIYFENKSKLNIFTEGDCCAYTTTVWNNDELKSIIGCKLISVDSIIDHDNNGSYYYSLIIIIKVKKNNNNDNDNDDNNN